jgi:1-acyl-sn-glycerol-3-phosphate acyltransferase
MASLSLSGAAVVAKCRSVQQGSHFLGANKKMHQLAVKTLPPIIHVKQHMVRCQSMAGASMPQSSPDESFPTATDVTLAQKVRAIFFYVTTFVVAAPLFVLMLVLHPFVLLFDKHRRKAHHLVNKLGRPFKFISKTSNFLIPIIGWSMYLTGHVPLKRMDKRSQMECLKTCLELVKQGVSVLFFPEGTRSVDGKMAAFKKGAFTVAAKGGVPVVPISLIGTGNLMPNGLEWSLRPGCVKVVIHHPLEGSNADQLCEESRAIIADTLVKHGLSVH